MVLLHYFKIMKEFRFLIYLSIPIGNFTWKARDGIFNSSISLFKTETKNRFLLHVLFPSYHILLIQSNLSITDTCGF